MYKGKKILAIIPARAGSKGIKNKNIIDLSGKPLIAYSIEAALKSKYIDRIVVSTDGGNIAKISKEYGAEVPFIRPKSLATDTSKSIDVVLHCIDELVKKNENYDYVILLQPTQPLRQSFHIDEAIELIYRKKENSLVSVCKVKEHPSLMRELNLDGTMNNIVSLSSDTRRQDFKEIFIVNGAIYINKINNELNKDTILNDNKIAYLMEEKYSIDIDEILDVKIANLMLKDIKENK